MLAISTTEALNIADAAIIKRAPPSIPSCLSLTNKPTAGAWSLDNDFLFLASAQAIQKYDPSTNSLEDIYSMTGPETISHLTTKDKGTVIFSAADKVYVLDCGPTPKVSQTFATHMAPITSLALSNDATLLASTSSGAAHIHNLSLGSHTVMRSLRLAGQVINTSTFHPHSRTRLLLGIGTQLVVYDTTRPSGPLKSIALGESTSGDITAIACSPFSKTLVAVATTGGNIGLIDLDKEKGLFRTFNFKVPLTTLGFSQEGAAIYVGTENGKLLVMDLRALDKPPKTIMISTSGSRIETMSIQQKLKGGIQPTNKPATSAAAITTTKSFVQLEPNPPRPPPGHTQTPKSTPKALPSAARARSARVGTRASPAQRRTVNATSPLTKGSTTAQMKKVFSPVRDPLGNSGSAGDISVQIETLSAMRAATEIAPIKKEKNQSVSAPRVRPLSDRQVGSDLPSTSISAGSGATTRATRGAQSGESKGRARTVPTAARSRTRKISTAESASVIATVSTLTVPAKVLSQGHEENGRARSRTASSASRAGSESASAISGRSARARTPSSRPGSSISRLGSSPIPPVPPLPVSRTPSPDLPDVNVDPITPAPIGTKKLGVLGLGTPEVDMWIRAGTNKENEAVDRRGKGKGKAVGFKDRKESEVDDGGEDHMEQNAGGEHQEWERERECERSLTMQISPRRPGTASSTSWAPSPLRHPTSGSPAGVAAHDLLRTIVQDIMYDFQRETKAEMTGLHLDLVRMGRGWKNELRGLMDEYVGDLKDLRDENRRLREENEMLRRG